MSERRTQTRYLPLRVRIRPSNELGQHGREQSGSATENTPRSQVVGVPDLSRVAASERHAQQVKELLRLSTILRANLSLEEILQQIAASMAACIGFRVIVINLLDETVKYLRPVAFAGVSEEDQHMLHVHPFSVEALLDMMSQEFRVSQSYFIPHDRSDIFNEAATARTGSGTEHNEGETGRWYLDDTLIVPLYSSREQRILGCISLDDPENGKIPTLESIGTIELFANNAAIAIDNMRISQEHEAERVSLEEGIAALCEELEQVCRGDLRVRLHSNYQKLQPMADAFNKAIELMNGILLDMQDVTQAVDEHTRNIQRNSEVLAHDARRQELQVNQISQIIGEFVSMMNSIAERVANLIHKALEAVEVKNEAQSTTDRAIEGMSMVREAISQSARTMKNLSESGQEINETISTSADLTTRMHLLALNAAIEASRAREQGQQGQGFVAIAQEIRTLATQSAEAARKVGSYIRTIQQETTTVSQSVEQSTQQVVLQTELVIQTGVALDAIGVVTDELTNLIQDIFNTAENQSQGSQVVMNAFNEILGMTGEVNRHMQEMQQTTNQLVELTSSLHARMSLIHLHDRS